MNLFTNFNIDWVFYDNIPYLAVIYNGVEYSLHSYLLNPSIIPDYVSNIVNILGVGYCLLVVKNLLEKISLSGGGGE